MKSVIIPLLLALFILTETESNGANSFIKVHGGPKFDRGIFVSPTTDGGLVLAGETTSSGAGEEDVYLIKTDSQGNMQWSRTFGGVKSDRCFSVVQAVDGGYVLAGQTYSEGAGDRDVYVIKTSATGRMEWSRTFGGEESDVGHYVAKTSDGNFMVTGYTTSFAKAGDDPYIIKLDAQGNTLWRRVLFLKGINHTLTGEQATDGGFFLVGFSQYQGNGTMAGLLIKTDAHGNLSWWRDILPTSIGETFGYTVRTTRDGGCIFTGHTTVNSAGHFDLLLVKH